MNVVLFYGGKSGEHEISLISCAAVAKEISYEHKVSLISVSKSGKWYLEEDSVLEDLRSGKTSALEVHEKEENAVSVFPGNGKDKSLFAKGAFIPCDAAFPVMHGTFSEDGTIQGLFEMCGIPFVGSGVLASAVSMDKETAKILCSAAGIPVVPYVCLRRGVVNDSRAFDKAIEEAIQKLGLPIFVKPCAAGSSDGASLAQNDRELFAAIGEAFSWDNKILLEKAINAREVECSVTGNSVTEDYLVSETLLKAYGPGEIVPRHEFYDYDAKYTDPNGADLKIPALLPEEKLCEIRTLAKKAYAALNESGLSRVDFFIDKNDGSLYLNEVNTLPGFTGISMFPKMCASEGLDFTNLIDLLLKEAVTEFAQKNVLRTSR